MVSINTYLESWVSMERLFSQAALAVLLTLSTTAADAADTPRAGLARIQAVKATVSQTTPSAADCGIDARVLLPRLERSLAEGGLALRGTAPVTVTMSLMTAYDGGGGTCATSVLLGAYRSVIFFDEEAGQLTAGDVVLWQRATEVLSPRGDHGATAERAVDRLSGALIGSWRAENAAAKASR